MNEEAVVEQIILKHGSLRFTALTQGPQAGAVVLLLHGFPDNPETFRGQMRALADAGYRVIAPTLRGYEPSSQPEDADYRIATMAKDVLVWIDQLGADKVHLVGHDWGAAIAYVAGALAPDRFHSLTTMAVPHAPRYLRGIRHVPAQLLNTWYMGFFQLRGIAEWLLRLNDWALLRWLCSRWSPGLLFSGQGWATRRAVLEKPGVCAAALSYYRQNVSLDVLLRLTHSEALTLSKVPVRTLAICGEQDGCMDIRLFEHVFHDVDFPAGISVKRIPDTGHFMHQEAPVTTNEALMAWFENHDDITA